MRRVVGTFASMGGTRGVARARLSLARHQFRTALSIEHLSRRHSLGQKGLWRPMQPQESDRVPGCGRTLLEPVVEGQAVGAN